MKDLISREALQQEALKLALKYFEIDDYAYEVYEMIEHAPAVDAVEVVRCYRCKHYIKSLMLCQREDGLDVPDKLDYCSYGERVSE